MQVFHGTASYGLYSDSTTKPFTISTSASERVRITNAGNVLIGGSLPSSPSITLNANGTATFGARVTSNRSTDGYAFEADYNSSLRGGIYASSTGASLVLKDSSGTTKVSLDGSNGSATLAGLLTLEASGTPFRFGTGDRGGQINLYQVGSIVNAGIELEAVHSIASEVSFKTQGTRRITIDRNGNFLIGGTLPSSPNISLNATGVASFADTVTSDRSTGGYSFRTKYNGLNRGGIYASSTGASIDLQDSSGVTTAKLSSGTSASLDLRNTSNQTTILLRSDNGSATFAGDIETTTAGDGVILKSPNGTRYRLTVANDGTLSTSAV